MANLELIDVKKTYDKLQVIHGIDLEISDGEFCVLVGPSGCGKSTLLRMIAGLEAITEGKIVIDGKTVSKLTYLKQIPDRQKELALLAGGEIVDANAYAASLLEHKAA